MNPSNETEDKSDSIPMKNQQEPVPAYQEIERLSIQSGAATSSTSSSRTPSMATLMKIAASLGKNKEPEFIRTQIESLSKVQIPISEQGLPPSRSLFKKPKQRPDPKPEPEPGQSDLDTDYDSPYLFDVFITNSDRLPIPYEIAADTFPSAATSVLTQKTIMLTDPLNNLWPNIAFVCFDAEEAFILTRNWTQYASLFNLRLMDTVRFLKPTPRLGSNHFLTQHFPRPESEPVTITVPVFIPENFLFQVELTQRDVGYGRLVIKKEQVNVYFPGITLREMVKFTDYRDKDWYVVMVYSDFLDSYLVIDGWERFMKEHELAAGDLVRFYKSDVCAHDKNFLIQFVKRENEVGVGPHPKQSSGGSKEDSDLMGNTN